MVRYKHIALEETVPISIVVAALLDEIEYIYKPLFQYIEDNNYENTPDNFNPIKILVPLVEVASRIECSGDASLLLEKLELPKPDIIWQMFRHGLIHYVRPFYAIVNGVRVNWAVPNYPCNHYSTVDSVGIYAPKLLNDLEMYLKSFRNDSNLMQIQTGIQLTSAGT
jgi:hypothetical protein